MSTFSLHGSFLITSGGIHATVPAKLIFVLCSDHCLEVPKSLIFMMSFLPNKMLKWMYDLLVFFFSNGKLTLDS